MRNRQENCHYKVEKIKINKMCGENIAYRKPNSRNLFKRVESAEPFSVINRINLPEGQVHDKQLYS
jgi:hypothetical protein